jgi:hypothetical protein
MPRRNPPRGRDGGGRWGSHRKGRRRWDDDAPSWPAEARRGDRRGPRQPERWREAWTIEPAAFAPPPAPVPSAVAPAAVCGNCREWFPDEVGGRGTCAHPGSGFLKPWSDTPACPFFHG